MATEPTHESARYIVESYRAGLTEEQVQDATLRMRRSAPERDPETSTARCVGSIYVPADEVAFHLFEASSADAVRDLCTRAGFEFERIVETVVEVDESLAGIHQTREGQGLSTA